MKKLRIGCIILLVISTAMFVAFRIYEKKNSDYQPPVISYQEEEMEISVEDDESVLLRDVKVTDEKAGDVSKALVVESISNFEEDGSRIVTYAAIDKNGNVARKQRRLRYTNYQPPTFVLDGPLRYPTGRAVNVLDAVRAESTLDGDLSKRIKYSMEKSLNMMAAGRYPIEFRVTDSGGSTIRLNTEVEIYDAESEKIKVDLKQYLVHLKVNDVFDPGSYYAGASEEGVLEVQSSVDVTTPGVYEVYYTVRSEQAMGKTRMLVVVDED